MDQMKMNEEEAKLQTQLNDIENQLKEESKTGTTKERFLWNQIKASSSLDTYPFQEQVVDLEHYQQLKQEMVDEDFPSKVITITNAANVTPSNGSQYFHKYNIKIGIIADEFLYKAYENTAELIYLTPDNYKDYKDKLDFVWIVTTWNGLNEEWKGLGNPKNTTMRKTIQQLIKFFKADNRTIVFYSKEDPPNYSIFIDIAKQCDIVFTTAAEIISNYQLDCQHERVYLLEFGFNPVYNNPINRQRPGKDELVVFAGSWYAKYPHRQKDTMRIFDDVIQSGENLKIIDRNYQRNHPNYLFPIKYLPFLSPSIDHASIQKLSMLHSWMVNLNSIQDSPTMFASRIFELQGMGNLILSNYSNGVNNLFPSVFMGITKGEIQNILRRYTTEELYEIQMFGVRKVMRKHTSFHRLQFLLKKIGMEVNDNHPKFIVVLYDEHDNYQQIKESFDRQTYPHKILKGIHDTTDEEQEMEYVTIFSDTYLYEEFHLEDMINGFKYTDVRFVTKDIKVTNHEIIPVKEHQFVETYSDSSLTMFALNHCSLSEWIRQFHEESHSFDKGYAIDGLEIQTVMKQINRRHHPKFSVIVPIYNNGDHLYGKCFLSLRRSSMFHEMEIILIDDGSTDSYTCKIVERLARKYSNIQTFFYPTGGSGSASRPRNKGIELATTPFITFLDPDNEAVNEGYTKLYQSIIEQDVDIVIGNIIKADKNCREVNYFKSVYECFPQQNIFTQQHAAEILLDTSFKSQSIQAMMMKKSFLLERKLKMVEGVVGEDTLYFWEVLYNAQSFATINEIIHIYFAGVEGSSVNNITLQTFLKYKKIEERKLEFLQNHSLLDEYLALRFSYYFNNWYLKKWNRMKEYDKDQAKEVLKDILEMYLPYMQEHQKHEWHLLMR